MNIVLFEEFIQLQNCIGRWTIRAFGTAICVSECFRNDPTVHWNYIYFSLHTIPKSALYTYLHENKTVFCVPVCVHAAYLNWFEWSLSSSSSSMFLLFQMAICIACECKHTYRMKWSIEYAWTDSLCFYHITWNVCFLPLWRHGTFNDSIRCGSIYWIDSN